MRYRFITIEGNIGAGKTTLSKKLAEHYNAKLILESFADNPFLAKFYDDPEKHAFAVELFFMAERYKQIQEFTSTSDLFHEHYISDYLFYKSLIFAKVTLNDDERRLFYRLFEIINSTLPEPEIIIYLHRRVETLLENIRKRGRKYELKIQAEYLLKLEKNYFQYLKSISNSIVIVADMDTTDFESSEKDFEKINRILDKSYEKGIHFV
ncbi:MAG: deoxynucleoside kinase [Chitinophagales bacterium]|nr:deoxynucleoside kinase [Chitinophagales bacterium]